MRQPMQIIQPMNQRPQGSAIRLLALSASKSKFLPVIVPRYFQPQEFGLANQRLFDFFLRQGLKTTFLQVALDLAKPVPAKVPLKDFRRVTVIRFEMKEACFLQQNTVV